MQTHCERLDETLVARLQDLIEVDLDDAASFEQAADTVDADELRPLFARTSSERTRFALDLQAAVREAGTRPSLTGSARGTLRRLRVRLRAALAGDDREALLSEAARTEELTRDAYEQAVVDATGTSVESLLRSHLAELRLSCQRYRELRERARPVGGD